MEEQQEIFSRKQTNWEGGGGCWWGLLVRNQKCLSERTFNNSFCHAHDSRSADLAVLREALPTNPFFLLWESTQPSWSAEQICLSGASTFPTTLPHLTYPPHRMAQLCHVWSFSPSEQGNVFMSPLFGIKRGKSLPFIYLFFFHLFSQSFIHEFSQQTFLSTSKCQAWC